MIADDAKSRLPRKAYLFHVENLHARVPLAYQTAREAMPCTRISRRLNPEALFANNQCHFMVSFAPVCMQNFAYAELCPRLRMSRAIRVMRLSRPGAQATH